MTNPSSPKSMEEKMYLATRTPRPRPEFVAGLRDRLMGGEAKQNTWKEKFYALFQVKSDPRRDEQRQENPLRAGGWASQLFPTLGWAAIIVCTLVILTWSAGSLIPRSPLSGANPSSGSQLALPLPTVSVTPASTNTTLPPTATTPLSYKVTEWDTCLSIAATFNVSVDALRQANGLTPNCEIWVGQMLSIPPQSNLASATSETPLPTHIPTRFELDVRSGAICPGPIALTQAFSVFMTTTDKSKFVNLDEGGALEELRSFAWSSDGKQLAVLADPVGNGNIYFLGPDGSQLEPALSTSDMGYLYGFAWSHDMSKLIAWESSSPKLYLVNKDDSGQYQASRITGFNSIFIDNAQFSPDDKSILYIGAEKSGAGLFQADLSGGQARKISGLVRGTNYAWSPDGSRLAYLELDEKAGEARLIVEDNGSSSMIAALPASKENGAAVLAVSTLSWSPDGKSLVFEAVETAGSTTSHKIYLAHADGSGLVELAESGSLPAVSADGMCLAFVKNNQLFVLDLQAAMASPMELVSPVRLSDLPLNQGEKQIGWQP